MAWKCFVIHLECNTSLLTNIFEQKTLYCQFDDNKDFVPLENISRRVSGQSGVKGIAEICFADIHVIHCNLLKSIRMWYTTCHMLFVCTIPIVCEFIQGNTIIRELHNSVLCMNQYHLYFVLSIFFHVNDFYTV